MISTKHLDFDKSANSNEEIASLEFFYIKLYTLSSLEIYSILEQKPITEHK